ncbi:PsbP-related protein [Flavobacterium sp. C3NV]|uniref:PsbP-related protein n=1 Tax=Flavobacterium sp. C3NV TaxID=3393358 RepID=UPI00399019BD
MKIVFQIVFLLYATLVFSQQNSEKAYRKLYISEKKYSLLFPENWYLKKTDSLQNSFMLLSEKSSLQDNFIENIGLLIKDIGYENVKPKMLKKIIDKKFGVSSEIISNRKVLKNGLTGQEIVYKTMLDNGYFATILQYYFIKGRDLYLLTFCSKPEELLDYMPTYQNIYDNFDIR